MELRNGLHLRFECPNDDLGADRPCATHYENTKPRPEMPEIPPGSFGSGPCSRDGEPIFVRYVDEERTSVPMTPEQNVQLTVGLSPQQTP